MAESEETATTHDSPRLLGPSGLEVGPVALGTMTFGGQVDEPMARLMIESWLEAGVTMFDAGNFD